MKESALNKQIVIKRLSQFSLAMLLVVMLGALLWHSDKQSELIRQQQQTAIAGILKQQLALAATMGLKLNEQQQLQWLAQSLNQSPLLNGVWIHREDGTLMAESIQHTEADITLPPQESLILAAEIRQDKLLGYLRLSLDKQVFVQPIVEIQQQQLKWQQWSILLAGAIGFLLARAFSQKRANYQLRDLLKRYRRKQISQREAANVKREEQVE